MTAQLYPLKEGEPRKARLETKQDGKWKQVAEADLDEKLLKRQQAIISSMTPAERRRPEILRASRKKRVAAGSGTTVADVNRLLKQFKDMHRMVKRMGKMEGKRIPTDLLRQSMPGGSLKFP